MARESRYKGVTVSELRNMNLSEFMLVAPARIRRSIKRGFTEEQKKLINVLKDAREGRLKKNIRTHCRDMVVIPEMIGILIFVYDGRAFVPVQITEEMLGHYLGEFVATRKKVAHSAPGIGATRSSAAASVK